MKTFMVASREINEFGRRALKIAESREATWQRVAPNFYLAKEKVGVFRSKEKIDKPMYIIWCTSTIDRKATRAVR